jgi:AcrR family transcriptional regulator
MLYVMSSNREYGDPGSRERILRATWDSLLEAGPEIRLADIAELAGLSRQAVYLHFGDRAHLLVEVLAWADQTLELGALLAGVREAVSGVEALERMVDAHAAYSPRIDAVARALEAEQYRDEAVAAALRDRLDFRRAAHREVIARLAAEGALAEGWTIDSATDLFAAVTMLGPWRELTQACGWSAEDYAERMSTFVRRALVAGEA